MSRWLFQPSGRSVICLATGRANLTRPGRDLRSGDVLETSDEDAARLSHAYRGVDGGPCLAPLDLPIVVVVPEPPAPEAVVEAAPVVAPDAGDDGPPEAPPEASPAPAPEAWAEAWPDASSAVLDAAGALPGDVEVPADGALVDDAGPTEGPGATGGDASPAPPPAPEVDLASLTARVEALHHNRRLAVARRLPGGGSVRRLDAALAVIERAIVSDPAAVEAAVSEVEASVAVGDRP